MNNEPGKVRLDPHAIQRCLVIVAEGEASLELRAVERLDRLRRGLDVLEGRNRRPAGFNGLLLAVGFASAPPHLQLTVQHATLPR